MKLVIFCNSCFWIGQKICQVVEQLGSNLGNHSQQWCDTCDMCNTCPPYSYGMSEHWQSNDLDKTFPTKMLCIFCTLGVGTCFARSSHLVLSQLPTSHQVTTCCPHLAALKTLNPGTSAYGTKWTMAFQFETNVVATCMCMGVILTKNVPGFCQQACWNWWTSQHVGLSCIVHPRSSCSKATVTRSHGKGHQTAVADEISQSMYPWRFNVLIMFSSFGFLFQAVSGRVILIFKKFIESWLVFLWIGSCWASPLEPGHLGHVKSCVIRAQLINTQIFCHISFESYHIASNEIIYDSYILIWSLTKI